MTSAELCEAMVLADQYFLELRPMSRSRALHRALEYLIEQGKVRRISKGYSINPPIEAEPA